MELEHGNATTFKEMLRVKRSVNNQFTPSGAASPLTSTSRAIITSQEQSDITELPRIPSPKRPKLEDLVDSKNPVDDGLEVDVEQQNVPDAVFGGLQR